MVKVRLLASFTGPAGVMPAGSVLETTEKEAASFVSHGYATYDLGEEAQGEIVTTESRQAPIRETAVSRPAKKRRK